MNKRKYLKNKILLCAVSDGIVFKRTFTITKMINDEGAFSICYEAYHEKSGRGVLKEFYPKNILGLVRDKNGQLLCSSDFHELNKNFTELEKEYIQPYEMLLAAKQSDSNQDISTFIPIFEIYHGCDEYGNIIGTTYIWTPTPELETFDVICKKIHESPTYKPEHKLLTVLTAIDSLTKCICILHSMGVIHRDIKPSNFGFLKRGDQTLTQTLSLFDINSLCSVYANDTTAIGTRGYMEPEAGYETADNQTDIYSIGATLFRAIVVSDEIEKNGGNYKTEYYDRLNEFVDDSLLIQASEANSHPRLRNILTTMLRKCLCERTYRYARCEEILSDLQIALFYALPSEFTQLRQDNQKWILADVEKLLDTQKDRNSSLAIQYHLYKNPLYQSCPDSDSINVLIVGLGKHGQKFLDICLQNGQLRNKKLNVVVVSDDVAFKEIYLSERPALPNFFNIDGANSDDENYGNVSFIITKLNEEEGVDTTALENLICQCHDNQPPHYIFVALGQDELNYKVAQTFKTSTEILDINCFISYIYENNKMQQKDSGICPLYINKDIKKLALYPEIERMAFNTHLVWEKNLNIGLRSIKSDYKRNYNHDSCISSVFSLKYKLFSMGINLDVFSFSEAAKIFKEIIFNKKNRTLRNELIWIEHRRWVTEKICSGWRTLQDIEQCISSSNTKNEKQKLHICIRKSRPDQKLAHEYTDLTKWDTMSETELSKLDDLDRMSVELHLMFLKKAKLIKEIHNPLLNNILIGISTLIDDNKQAVTAFEEWLACMRDIQNGDISKAPLYKSLKNTFLKITDKFTSERKIALEEQINALETIFRPILASMEYRNFKNDDMALVDNIPFILTYTEEAYLVVPFAFGDNTSVFGNVSAATVAGPSNIIYLCLVETNEDFNALCEYVPYVIEYMRKKNFNANVEFVLICKNTKNFVIDELKESLLEVGNGKIRQIKIITFSYPESISRKLKSYLKQRAKNKRFFALEKNSTILSYMLQGSGLYNSFASYSFDSYNIKFYDIDGCDMLEYITKRPYITVSDMATFNLSSGERGVQSEFFEDYKELWAKYCEKPGFWKLTCDILAEYSDKNDIIASFRRTQQHEKSNDAKIYTYILPSMCRKTVSKIIDYLKTQEILEKESYVRNYTADSCQVVIADRCNALAEYDSLFANVYALMLPDDVRLFLDTKRHEVKVIFNGLVVKDLQITGSRPAEILSLLKFFKNKGYILDLCVNQNQDTKISFTYATGTIKELLTTAGKILEIYTSHKVKELGKFDDVASSFEVNWKGTEVKSEFDCVLTKGFRSLFVECKARSDISQEFYFKLTALAHQFGINAKAVLVADTQEKSFHDNAAFNAMQRKRGDMLDVITIWKPDEINDIGHTLLKIINGTYITSEE